MSRNPILRIWDDNVTRNDLESSPGIIDPEIVRTLSLNTYIQYIKDFIGFGGNQILSVASDQVENFMTDVFMCYTHAVEGRYPEPEEIVNHLRKPENVAARQYLTYICVHANLENWPEFETFLRDRL